MRKMRILAGILSAILFITTVFTNNFVIKAEEITPGSVSAEMYREGKYVITGEADSIYSSIVVPNGCCLRIDKAITVVGNITVCRGGRVEIVDGGAVSCDAINVDGTGEAPDPMLNFQGIANVPVVNGSMLDLYEWRAEGPAIMGYTDWNWPHFRHDVSEEKWIRINPYDEFGPEEGKSVVEVVLRGFNRNDESGFPIAFSGVAEGDKFDGWDRMKVRVSGDSLTLSWNPEDEPQPLQICVEGAGEVRENGERDWLIYNVESNQYSYTIALDDQGRDFYFVEVKYNLNDDGNHGGDNIHDVNINLIADLSGYADDATRFGFDISAYSGTETGVGDKLDGTDNHTDFDKQHGTSALTSHLPDNAGFIGFRISDAGQKIETASYTIGETEVVLTDGELRDLVSESGYTIPVIVDGSWVNTINFKVKIVPGDNTNPGENPGPGENPNPGDENESDEYPDIKDANIFVNSNMGGMIGELKFNNVNIQMNRRGTKGAQKVTDSDKYTVRLQLEFGAMASAITINGERYDGDKLVALNSEGDMFEFTVPRAEDGIYNISFERTESTVSTIIWTYNPEDPRGPQGDTYSEDALVLHGKIEIVTIRRGEHVLYDAGNYCDGVDPESDKVTVDINETLQRGYVRLERGDDIVIRLIPDYGYQLVSASVNDRELMPKSTDFRDVSTFVLQDVQGQMHFSGAFQEKNDVINTTSESISSATISDGENAAASGNLLLNVKDAAVDPKALENAVNNDTDNEYAVMASLDMALTNVVSMGPGKGDWTNGVTEFDKEITVGLNLDGIELNDGEELIVVREHNGEYDVIAQAQIDGSTLEVPTNRFSTYTIVKRSAKQVCKVSGIQLVIDSNFDLKFFVDIADEVKADEESYVEFTVGGNAQRVKYSAISGSCATYICEVPSKCIADDITAKLYFDGQYYDLDQFSIKEYLEYVIENPKNIPELAYAKEVAEAILTYGAYAQNYFGYNTDNLANESLENDPVKGLSDRDVAAAIDISMKTTNNEDFSYLGASLICNSDTFVRIYLSNNNNLTLAQIEEKYDYYVAGGSNPITNIGVDENVVYLELQNIPAAELDNIYIFVLESEDTEVMIKYSPYIYISQAMSVDNDSLKNLCKALYLYSVAANEYYNKYTVPA